MSQYLCFMREEGSRLGRGNALDPNETILQHITLPLSPKDPLPTKSGLQKVVEKADAGVLVTKDNKKKQTERKRSAAGGPSQSKRRRKAHVVDVEASTESSPSHDDSQGTHSVTPINTARSESTTENVV